MPAASRSGTQSIERAVAVVKALASRGNFGWRLVDLSAHCNLDKGTTHRILRSLARERLVQQRADDRRYVPGPLLFELGVSVPGLAALSSRCHGVLVRLARRFGGAAMLYLRSGSEFVCIARVDAQPLKALTIDVGTRRPLIVSAGGAAILIALPRREADAVVARNLLDVARFGDARIAAFRRMLLNSRRAGMGLSQGDIVPGISAFGAAVCDAHGEPLASVSVVATTDRFAAVPVVEVGAALAQEAAAIAREAEGMGLRAGA
jgi:DNA-binding IclR family transcriptional regulator